jgi:hypothetical protein
MQGQEVTQGVDGRMHFAALSFLVPVVATTRPTLWTTLHGATVQNDGRGLLTSALGDAQNLAQIGGHRLEAARFQPAPCLLVERAPRWQIVG